MMNELTPLASLHNSDQKRMTHVTRSPATPFQAQGKVTTVSGPIVFCSLPRAAIGDQCVIELRDGSELPAQVIGFNGTTVRIAPFDSTQGLSAGCVVRSRAGSPQINISDEMKGCVLDCLGNISGRTTSSSSSVGNPSQGMSTTRSLEAKPPKPMSRRRVSKTFVTGVRSIDGLCTLGVGQRIGLFAPPGVGKSTLLSMIAKNAHFDTCVIALVGERGREVREFVEDALGQQGMSRSVLVLATSDESPMRRRQAAFTATAVAEHFRDKGESVLLLVDSLTRMARASREVGLAAGELPVRKGYTSSVFTELPMLLERAGMSDKGAITAIYTVLTEDANIDDPLAEEVKSILDGHFVLSRDYALRGVYPAIDPLQSVSRLMTQVRSEECLALAQKVRAVLARIEQDRDIILFGGQPDAELSSCLSVENKLLSILGQDSQHYEELAETDHKFAKLIEHQQALLKNQTLTS